MSLLPLFPHHLYPSILCNSSLVLWSCTVATSALLAHLVYAATAPVSLLPTSAHDMRPHPSILMIKIKCKHEKTTQKHLESEPNVASGDSTKSCLFVQIEGRYGKSVYTNLSVLHADEGQCLDQSVTILPPVSMKGAAESISVRQSI